MIVNAEGGRLLSPSQLSHQHETLGSEESAFILMQGPCVPLCPVLPALPGLGAAQPPWGPRCPQAIHTCFVILSRDSVSKQKWVVLSVSVSQTAGVTPDLTAQPGCCLG